MVANLPTLIEVQSIFWYIVVDQTIGAIDVLKVRDARSS